MSTNYSVKVNAPNVANRKAALSVTTAASTYVDLGTPIPVRIWVKSSVQAHIIFTGAATAVPTTSDPYLTADQDYILDIPVGLTRFRVKGTGAGSLVWAVVA